MSAFGHVFVAPDLAIIFRWPNALV